MFCGLAVLLEPSRFGENGTPTEKHPQAAELRGGLDRPKVLFSFGFQRDDVLIEIRQCASSA